MSVVFLFPGQGSQYPGMLHELPEHPVVKTTLEEASTILQKDVYDLDTQKALNSTIAVQLSLLIAGVAVARSIKAEGVTPDMVAGHSVGAFGAAVVAKSLQFKDALSIVQLRAQLMEAAYPQGFGMGVIVGLTERQVLSLIRRVFTEELPVFPANLNAPTQITLAGALPSLERVLTDAQTLGARKVQLLNVSVSSHCPLLEPVSTELNRALSHIPLKDGIIPYAGNMRARALWKAEAIRKDLALGVAHPVRWHEATTLLYELGARLFIEMPPGHVLSDLAKQAFPSVRSVSLSEVGMNSAILLANHEKSISQDC